jgi:hypothetical protein
MKQKKVDKKKHPWRGKYDAPPRKMPWEQPIRLPNYKAVRL